MNGRRRGSADSASATPRAQLPFLDRLLDTDEDAAHRASPSAAQALERLHSSVRRSLTALLNARRRPLPMPMELSELTDSLLTYGLPDVAAGVYNRQDQRAALAREIELTIRRFEPRLTQVSVSLVTEAQGVWGTLRLKVDAVLRAEPVPEPVAFETLLEPVSRTITVREHDVT